MKIFSERELRDQFNDFFNEIFPLVQFGSLSFEPADVLESVDPVCWRQEFLSWMDSQDLVDDPNSDGFVYQSDLDRSQEEPENLIPERFIYLRASDQDQK